MKQHVYKIDRFELESGDVLKEVKLRYNTYGRLSEKKDNICWVFHPLSLSPDVYEWWGGIFGRGKILNPADSFIICVNNLGSCYGSTGPKDINIDTGRPFYSEFPEITIRDIVKTFRIIQSHLGISKIKLGIGGSMGGSLALQWATETPDLFEQLILMACGRKESPWSKAIHTAQRMAIEADSSWGSPEHFAGEEGLKAARAMGCISYKSREYFTAFQNESSYDAESYQRYQGEKIKRRFNAYSYYTLLRTLDTHDISFSGFNQRKLLSSIKAKCLLIAIKNDLLIDPMEMKEMADSLTDARFEIIDSIQGHDGFLTETERILGIYNSWVLKEIPQEVF